MEKRRLQRLLALPPVVKGLLFGALAGCALTVIWHVLYLWLGFQGNEGVGILVGCAWSIIVNELTASLCRLLAVNWDLGSLSKPSPTQFLIILTVNTIACGLLGAVIGCVRQCMKCRE